jgi:hypothetical protein
MDVVMLGRGRVRSIVSGIIAICCASVFAVNARANTIWVVHVDVTSGNDLPVYTITSTPPGASNCDPKHTAHTSQGDVPICPGDSIQWAFVTKGGNGSLTIHQSDGILKDGHGNAKYWIREQEQGLADTNTEDPTIVSGVFKYCVAIYDNGSNRVYTHDPKIIVGGGSPFELLKPFEAACHDLVVSIRNSSEADKARQICADADKKLQKLLSPRK